MYTADEITFWDRRLRMWQVQLGALTGMLVVIVLSAVVSTSGTFALLGLVVAPLAFSLWRIHQARRRISTASDPALVTGHQLDLVQRDLRLAAVLVLPLGFVATVVTVQSIAGASFLAAFLTIGIALVVVAGIASAFLFTGASAFRRDGAGLPVSV